MCSHVHLYSPGKNAVPFEWARGFWYIRNNLAKHINRRAHERQTVARAYLTAFITFNEWTWCSLWHTHTHSSGVTQLSGFSVIMLVVHQTPTNTNIHQIRSKRNISPLSADFFGYSSSALSVRFSFLRPLARTQLTERRSHMAFVHMEHSFKWWRWCNDNVWINFHPPLSTLPLKRYSPACRRRQTWACLNAASKQRHPLAKKLCQWQSSR